MGGCVIWAEQMLNNAVLCMYMSERIVCFFLVVYSFPSPITGDLQSPPPTARLTQHPMNILSFTWLQLYQLNRNILLAGRGNIHSNEYILTAKVTVAVSSY